MSAPRWLLFGLLLAVVLASGAMLLATRGASSRLQADLASAEEALRQGDAGRAAALARDVLEREPATGRAFGVLARALAKDGDDAARHTLLEVASRRAPRDRGVRARLARQALQSSDFAAAVDHLDALLTIAPSQRSTVLDLIAGLARDPSFSDALADHLQRQPQWRGAILNAAVAHGDGMAANPLHRALRAHGGLSAAETARWLDGLLRNGHWGSAYAHWASTLDHPGERLAVPWNGDFARAPTSSGFDWHLRRTPGVLIDRITLDEGGYAMRLRFLGRPVDRTGLEVPLLLTPGDHRLRLRARARHLRADQGLAWTLTCSDRRTRIAEGAPVRATAGWTTLALDFTVPADDGCQGQWLRLVNPAPRGVAQILRGEVLLADVGITPRSAAAATGD